VRRTFIGGGGSFLPNEYLKSKSSIRGDREGHTGRGNLTGQSAHEKKIEMKTGAIWRAARKKRLILPDVREEEQSSRAEERMVYRTRPWVWGTIDSERQAWKMRIGPIWQVLREGRLQENQIF